jgi:RND family efflux transporter MFP subunit
MQFLNTKPCTKNTALIMCSLLLISTTLVGCGGAPQSPVSIVPVRVETLSESNVQETSEFLALLDSKQAVMIYPRVEGQIASVNVTEGQQVSQGQVLMTIDSAKQQADFKAAQAESQAQQKGIAQQENLLVASQALKLSSLSNTELAQKQFTRFQNLATKGAASKQELDRATDTLNKANNDIAINEAQIKSQAAAVENAKSRYLQSQAGIAQQQATLDYYVIRAPFSGTVGDVPVKVGTMVNSSMMLTQVVRGQQLEVKLKLPVDRQSQIALGQNIILENDKGERLGEAKINFISPSVDPQNQTILVKAMVDNSKNQFKVSQIIRAKIVWKETPGLSVPPTGVLHAAGQDFVFTIGEDKKLGKVAKQIPVKLGVLQNNRYIVISGLKTGDTIIKEGIQKLQNNVPITVLAQRKPVENKTTGLTEKDLKEADDRMEQKRGQ